MSEFTHTDQHGKARMVDVGDKPDQKRIAIAEGYINLQSATIQMIVDNKMKKGDVLTVARIAGIQAGKKTAELIPLCHPLSLSFIDVREDIEKSRIRIVSEVHTTGPTGVEMEALMAVEIALLTIYDMCKAVDKHMCITGIRLVSKEKS